MAEVILQNAWVWYHINKDEGDESPPVLATRRNVNVIFLKYSKEGRSFYSHV